MILYSDGEIEYEKDDFISYSEWDRFLIEKAVSGKTFRIKPHLMKNVKQVHYKKEKPCTD